MSDDVLKQAKSLFGKYLMLSKELLKFIDKQDVDTFLDLVEQRGKIIDMLKALPANEYRRSAEGQAVIQEIRPLDMQIVYKAKVWLNRSRRKATVTKAYDLTSARGFTPVGNLINRKF